MTLLARGARRPGSPFAGCLEPLSLLEGVYVRKGGREIQPLTQTHLLHGWPQLRSDLARMACGLCGLDALATFLSDPLPHEPLFESSVAFLASIESGHDGALCLARLLCVLCQELGIAPRLDACARCEDPVVSSHPPHSPSLGGILCEPCGQDSRLTRLTPELLEALRRMGRGTRPDPYPPALQREVERFYQDHLLAHTRRTAKLEAWKLWDEVRP